MRQMTDDLRPLSATEEKVLRTLPEAIDALLKAWDEDLTRRHGLSQVEYTALRVLSEADGQGRQLSLLAEDCLQSLSAMSRTVDRLEARGLVERRRGSSDRRAVRAVLTERGASVLKEAGPEHLRLVRRTLFDQLEGIDLSAMAEVLRRIVEGAQRARAVR
ncbi:DNA-binding transcriptional regulator, MarR family [Streptomyces sp. DI166]|nr:DNA-binding transcriptional regulator, MarR family [Streptomyces sp. DI166]